MLVLFNSAAMGVSSAMTFFILGWMVAAPVLAAVTPARENYSSPHLAGLLPAHVGAGAILTVVFFVAFFVAGLVLAPGS